MSHSKSKTFFQLFAVALLSLTPQVMAQAGTSTSLANLKLQMDSVALDLAAGNLKRIHHFAEGINEAVKDLDKDLTLNAAKQKRVQGYVKNIAKLTDAMHDAADAKNLDETKKQAKKLKAQIGLLEKQFMPAKTGAKPKLKEKMDSTKMDPSMKM